MSDTKEDLLVVLSIVERGLKFVDRQVPLSEDNLKDYEQQRAKLEKRKAFLEKELEELDAD